MLKGTAQPGVDGVWIRIFGIQPCSCLLSEDLFQVQLRMCCRSCRLVWQLLLDVMLVASVSQATETNAPPIVYWAPGRPLSYLFSWGKFSFLIFSAWQEHCWAHKEAHQLLAGCLDKGITPAEAGELQSCLIYIVIYSAGIPVLPEYKLAFQHIYRHTPTESSAVTDNYTQKPQPPCIMEDRCW